MSGKHTRERESFEDLWRVARNLMVTGSVKVGEFLKQDEVSKANWKK